ncbi:hypothetical protein BO78DRAFT_212297 [Aspergillus sclerotiicarbonarius CBS 121057]|uniref:Uncharacterized protein n=1 Tax=Aspergillus sclerotiicarbonarius (strain CBS 121057 / IBT 28362) TaxID=1448318 RepID=A0A319E073_ASPSB|nr:hypothetical protein BO78DRAFT_212297 [Aspergillus sclerotiicarbonarius CBS 121057]
MSGMMRGIVRSTHQKSKQVFLTSIGGDSSNSILTIALIIIWMTGSAWVPEHGGRYTRHPCS